MIRIEYDLPRASRRGQSKVRLFIIREDLSDQYIFACNDGVDREQCNQIVRSFFLRDFAGHYNSRASFGFKLYIIEFYTWNGGSAQPIVIEPVQRFFSIVPEWTRQIFFKCVDKFAGAQSASLRTESALYGACV